MISDLRTMISKISKIGRIWTSSEGGVSVSARFTSLLYERSIVQFLVLSASEALNI